MTMFDMDRFDSDYPQEVGKYRDDQLARISTWNRVPDSQTEIASMHVVHVAPTNGTTVTHVNPLDPGNPYDSSWYTHDDARSDRLIPAGRP